MALIVEDGTGKVDSNSYDTSANANTYFLDRGVTTDIQDSDMISAAEFIEATYGASYLGFLMTQEQAMLYPRTAFVDNNGRTVKSGTIPPELKTSQYQAAKLNSEGVVLIDNPDADSQLQSLTNTVEGAVSQSKTWFSPVTRSQTAYVGKYLSPLLDSSSGGAMRNAIRG